MTKKLCALFLFCCMVVGMSTPCAAATDPYELFNVREITEHSLKPLVDSVDIIGNGSFEYTASAEKPSDWGLSAPNDQSFLGSENIILNDTRHTDTPADQQIVKSGYRALRLKNEVKGLTMAVQATGILRSPSQMAYECELGVSFYMLSEKAGVSMEIIVSMGEGEDASSERFSISFTNDLKKDEWVTKMVAFTLPISARKVNLQPRLSTAGDVIMDDVVFLQQCDQEFIDQRKPREVMPRLEGQVENMVGDRDAEHHGNVDFEYTQTDHKPWLLSHVDTPEDIRFSTNENHTPGGKQSFLLQNITDTRGRLYQNVYDYVPGATYQLTWWYKVATETQCTISYENKWFACEEPWDEPGLGIAGGDGFYAFQEGEWKQFIHQFVAPYPPEGGKALSSELCIRIGGKGASCYFDDVQMYMVKEPDVGTIQSDEAIYYTEWRSGTIDAEIANYYHDKMQGASLRYEIYDGDKVIFPAATTPFVEDTDGKLEASGEFPTSIMQANKKGQTYTYKAQILDAAGNVVQEKSDNIYRFDRPHYLGVDGVFRKNGKEYNIGVGNTCNSTYLERGALASGVDIVIMVGEGDLSLIETLDLAYYEYGALCLINMGDSSTCAGSPSRLVQTMETVNTVKDHPGLFGYKVQDEPLQKLTPEKHLRDAYVTIRELDPNHVIYSDDGVDGSFPTLARYTDYFDTDHYPGGKNSATLISDTTKNAEEASRGRKPVAILQKGYSSDTTKDTYLPTIEEYRHYAYQTMFAGSGGWGFHRFGKNDGGPPLLDEPVWPDIVAWGETGERELLHACFVEGKYPMINAYEDDELMWQIYAVDGKLYAFVVNRVGGVGNREGSLQVNIPLTDASTGKSLGGFTATCKWGAEGSVSGTDVLSFELPSFTAVAWEIELTNPVNFAGYKITQYNDIYKTPWAYQAVAKLQQAKVLNEDIDLRYEPQAQITRGDYAMFLVRALGLTADATENFADVKPYAEYADALAIGKALGIFNGRGDNMYDPEKPATRAELMALTARALRLVGKAAEGDAASLDAFSDKALIPEWAAGDVAAMVSMGIVKGNADGTVNPNGNTTRAEAAVIVDRVMAK